MLLSTQVHRASCLRVVLRARWQVPTVAGLDFHHTGKGKYCKPNQAGGAVWFVLKDVCEVIGVGNPSMVATRLEETQRGIIPIDTPSATQEMVIVSEDGLYDVRPDWWTHIQAPFVCRRRPYSVHLARFWKLASRSAFSIACLSRAIRGHHSNASTMVAPSVVTM